MAEQSMFDLTNWEQIDCRTSDAVRRTTPIVASSLTDIDGDFGEPIIYTEWVSNDGDTVLRDYRYPKQGNHCLHYVLRSAGGEG